jgi:small GTP-binding protein
VSAVITKLKICLIGATAVGKTSLASRFVHSIFSEAYRTTIGVRIEAREVRRAGHAVQLVIWDLSGEDEFQSVQPAYVAGSAGYLLVIDGIRRETVATARLLSLRVRAAAGNIPFVVVVNKVDLRGDWEVTAGDLAPLEQEAGGVFEVSARSGFGVAEAFEALVDRMLPRTDPRWTGHPWT